MSVINKIKKEEFLTIYRSLPQDVQAALFAEETAEKMMVVKNKFSIRDEVFGDLVKLVSRIMLGLINPKDFIKLIIEITSADTDTAQNIGQEINQTIFQPIRNSLIEIHNISDKLEKTRTNNNQQILPPDNKRVREELLTRLRGQNPPPQMTPPPTPTQRQPFQARPAQYYYAPARNIIDLRAKKRKNSNSKKKYKGFFANY